MRDDEPKSLAEEDIEPSDEPTLEEELREEKRKLAELKKLQAQKEELNRKVQKLVGLKEATKREAKALRKTRVPSVVSIERRRKLKKIGGGLLKGLKFAGREAVRFERSKKVRKAARQAGTYVLYGKTKVRKRRVR